MKTIFSGLAVSCLILFLIGFTSNEKFIKETKDKQLKNIASPKFTSKIISKEKSSLKFQEVNLFNDPENLNDINNGPSIFTNATILKLNKNAVIRALAERKENILFQIPLAGGSILELDLTQSNPSSADFTLVNKYGNNKKFENYIPRIHYSGHIKGNENSIASISIFKEFVMGIISDENGNQVLGSVRNEDKSFSDKYIFYNDNDLLVKNNYKCGVDGYEEKFTRAIQDSKNMNEINFRDNPVRLPVRIYFEADYELYLNGNSNTQTVSDFIHGMFNSVKTIYQNEGIPIEISQIGIWTTPDPYRNIVQSFDILKQFGVNNKDDFQGNLAHLLSTRNVGLGGIAWIRVLCSDYSAADSAGRFAFSNIEPNYNTFPTYSWTVNVVSHEMGHSMGSSHTHACVWPVGATIGAIDSCYFAEGLCFSQPRARIGTMMSYCHLWTQQQGGGVNLALGFGQLPGDTIRLRYSQARCLDQALNSSERPSAFNLIQNFPNPFNPFTVIRFALPVSSKVDLKVYDVNGRLIDELIHNKFYEPGLYDFNFNSADYNLSSGIYFYHIAIHSDKQNGVDFTQTKRMILLK